jgi:pimeloyl-ACP methyl ester carboxylesterase
MLAAGRAERRVSFLETVDTVAAEIEDRLPGYFRRQPLRCVAAGPLAEACHRLARAWDLPVVPVADDHALNAVDRYLRDRLAGEATREIELGDERSLAAFRRPRAEARAAVRARVSALPRLLERHEVGAVPGLSYAAIGRGEPPVVAVNALGQTLAAWLPVLERLSRRRRVVIWEMRETDRTGRPITFAEHGDDLHAILAQEGTRPCHLLGWCTGAKLATRYCRTHPGAVASLVVLSGSFKHPGRPPELDTAYERNLEAMLQAIARQPALADRLRIVLARTAIGEADLDRMDGDALALHALSGVPAGLERDVRRPFRDAAALAVYARQHLELWAHDETAAAAEIRVPTLALSGEHDRIVSPAGARAAVARFPVSRFELIAGTTHHCFHERSDAVAARIEEWIETAQNCAHGPAPGMVESGHD